MFEAAPEAPGGWRRGGVSLLGTEEPSKQGLTQKKILNRGKSSQQMCRRYSPRVGAFPLLCVVVIPSPLSAYGVATLFPLPRQKI